MGTNQDTTEITGKENTPPVMRDRENLAAIDPTERELATYSKALSHPTRIRILHLLWERKQCIVNDIVDELPVVQSTVSQHLKVLKDAGLIQGQARGPRTLYSVDHEHLRRLKVLVASL